MGEMIKKICAVQMIMIMIVESPSKDDTFLFSFLIFWYMLSLGC